MSARNESQSGRSSLASSRHADEPCREIFLLVSDRPGTIESDRPSPLAVQRRSNPATDFNFVVSARDEQRSESSPLNLIVMGPAARAIVIPMAAERDRYGCADRGWIDSFEQNKLSLMDERLRDHGQRLYSRQRFR